MTRQERLGFRDLGFSQWVRQNLPDSRTGFYVSDLDFIICNINTKKIMLLEVKTMNNDLKPWQDSLFTMLDRWLSIGVDQGWEYLGFKKLIFEKTNIQDGMCWLDGQRVLEEELVSELSI